MGNFIGFLEIEWTTNEAERAKERRTEREKDKPETIFWKIKLTMKKGKLLLKILLLVVSVSHNYYFPLNTE